jgi:hypothetical protein
MVISLAKYNNFGWVRRDGECMDLRLSVQSVPKVFSMNTAHGEVYLIQHWVSFCTLSFGHCFVCSFSIYRFWLPLWYLQNHLDKVCQWFTAGRWLSSCIPVSSTNWPPRYSWNSVESGVKHQNHNPYFDSREFIKLLISKTIIMLVVSDTVWQCILFFGTQNNLS